MAGNEDLAHAPRPKARELNELIRYTMWSVFRVGARGGLDQQATAAFTAVIDHPHAVSSPYLAGRAGIWTAATPPSRSTRPNSAR